MSIIHILFGEQRTGKTLYLAYKAITEAYDVNRLNRCHAKIDSLNTIGYNFSKPRHLCFSDFDIEIHHWGKAPDINYWIDGFYLGLPHHVVKNQKLTYRTLNIPPFVNLYLDEGNKYFDSRNKEIMPDFRKRWVELMGQWGLTLTMVCHRPMLVDVCIRDLADFRQFLKTEFTYDCFGNIRTAKIFTRYFPTNKDFEAFLNGNIITDNVIEEAIDIDCFLPGLNIPKYYNTEFYSPAFLRFCENKDFDLLQKTHDFNSIEDVQKFNKQFNYSVPKGLYEKGVENG